MADYIDHAALANENLSRATSHNPERDIEWYRRDLALCMAGGGHWCGRWGHCGDHCGCKPCAEDRKEPTDA